MLAAQHKTVFPLITAVISLVLILIAAEVGIRLFVENSHITPERLRKRSVQYEPALFARSVFSQEARTIIHLWGNRKGLEWEINDKGYRGPHFEIKKPQGVTRIVVYGGSAVFDSRNTRGEDWPHRVQGKLSTTASAKFEVINAGIMGHTALESAGRLFTEGHVFEPDYVLL